MKTFQYLLLFLVTFVVGLALKFPYGALVDNSIHRFERATQAHVEYTPRGASLFGVQLENVRVSFPSGVKIDFDSARLRPSWGRLSAHFVQNGGQAQLNLEPDGQILLKMDKIKMDSGSKELGQIRATGDLSYQIRKSEGSGDLRLEIPKFQAPLPVPELAIDAGSKLTYVEKTPGAGHEIRAEAHLLSGTEFSADGNVMVTPQQGNLPSQLAGQLSFRTPFKRGNLLLGGSWKKPQFTVAGGI